MGKVKNFLKDWTLPVAIAVGTVVYLTFYWVPQLDAAGEVLGEVVDTIFPMMVFCTLFSTFCRIDFHQMLPHRWHVGVLMAQLLLVALNVWIIFCVEANVWQKILWESVLTCIIGPAATAAPVVTAKIGGNINTMTAFVVLSSFASALMIPAVFPLLERGAGLDFWTAFLIILQKLALVLILPFIGIYTSGVTDIEYILVRDLFQSACALYGVYFAALQCKQLYRILHSRGKLDLPLILRHISEYGQFKSIYRILDMRSYKDYLYIRKIRFDLPGHVHTGKARHLYIQKDQIVIDIIIAYIA